MSGADIVFVLGFRCREGETPRNVDVGLAVGPSEKRPFFRLYRSYTNSVFTTVPTCGEFRCHIPKFPLSAGCFTVSARITVGREEADWPTDGIGYLNVENGDFYGSGKAADKDTPFLVSGRWEFSDALLSASDIPESK
jgi:lipopolysaccharide transport system ATP-binding protein